MYRLKCRSENCSVEVTRLHHSIHAAFNITMISLFERKLSQSNVTKPSHKLNFDIMDPFFVIPHYTHAYTSRTHSVVYNYLFSNSGDAKAAYLYIF